MKNYERYIYRVPRYTKLDYLNLNLRILKLDDLFELELGKFMHQFHNDKLPKSFAGYFQNVGNSHQHNTRAANTLNYVVKKCNKKMGEHSVKYIGAKLWNNLQNNIQTANKFNFIILLKTIYFLNYRLDCLKLV